MTMLVRTSIVAAPTRSFCCSLRGVSCTGALTPWHGFEGIADDAFEDDAFEDDAFADMRHNDGEACGSISILLAGINFATKPFH